MGQTHPLGILVFDAAGQLLRHSPEVAELTGHPEGTADTLDAWLAQVFPDGLGRAVLAAAQRELLSSSAQGSRGFEFDLPFCTAGGDLRDGHFTVALAGAGEAPMLLVSLSERAPSAEEGPGPEVRDVLGQALEVVESAGQNLLSILDESQARVIEATEKIRGDQVALAHRWDGLFQEAFALARMRDLVKLAQDSLAIARDAARSQVRQADPDRPLAGVPVGRPVALPLGLSLHKLERFWILSTLQAVQGNRSDCARHLDIALRTVRNKLGEYKQAGFKIPSASRGRRVKARLSI